jgi:DNA-binding NarL/FixJ family response regulator
MVGSQAAAGSGEFAVNGATPVRTIKVLVVDPEQLVRAGVRSLLLEPGVEIVGEAVSGREAIRAIGRFKPHVVLMALHLDDIDGVEATKIIKQHSPDAAVVILSRENDPQIVRKAIEAGATSYLLQSTSREMLLQAVRLARVGASLIDAEVMPAFSQHNGVELPDADASAVATLSPREVEVLRYLAAGLTNKEIAHEMHYSVGTVKNVVQRTIEKLRVTDRTQAAVLAVRAGL